MAQHACANFAVQAAISALRKPQQVGAGAGCWGGVRIWVRWWVLV
jgi:hypothetical protein